MDSDSDFQKQFESFEFPEEIEIAATDVTSNMLPEKSRKFYEKVYEKASYEKSKKKYLFSLFEKSLTFRTRLRLKLGCKSRIFFT